METIDREEGKVLKIGIIGCGFVSSYNVAAWKRLGHRVEALCDMNKDAMDKVSKQVDGYIRQYSSAETMLKMENLDAVSICTPPSSHFALIVEALDHGCLVVVEKPYILSSKEAELLKDSSKICVLHTQLYESFYREGVKLVNEGILGKIFEVSVYTMATPEDYMTRDPLNWSHKLKGGRMAECLSHPVYICQAFSGHDELTVESAWAVKPTASNLYHLSYSELWAVLYGSNVRCSINVRLDAPFRDVATAVVMGEKGLLLVGIVPEGYQFISYDSEKIIPFPRRLGGDSRTEIIRDFLEGKSKLTARHGFFNVRAVEDIVEGIKE